MSVLLLLVVVVIVLAIACYGVSQAPMIEAPWKSILICLFCAIAILVICNKTGLL